MNLVKMFGLLAVLALSAPAALAQEEAKKEAEEESQEAAEAVKPLLGSWAKLAGDFEIVFTVKPKGKLSFEMKNSLGDGLKFDAKYKLEKKGRMEIAVEKSEAVGDFPTPPKGAKFKMTWQPEGKDKVKLTELEGEGADEAAEAVEGIYERKKPKDD